MTVSDGVSPSPKGVWGRSRLGPSSKSAVDSSLSDFQILWRLPRDWCITSQKHRWCRNF